jgi:methionyl aminopeptidase
MPITITSVPPIEESLRIAGDIHKHVRRKMRDSNILVPGASLIDISNFIETETKEYTSIVLDSLGGTCSTINNGIGFPVGLSVNDCAAHYHPHSQDTHAILSNSDIVKVDFGTEVNGWIVDSAFTTRIGGGGGGGGGSDEVQSKGRIHCNSHSFSIDDCDSLISCMKDATELGIRNIGIDVRISEWSASIEELIRSHEGVFPIYNLTGHDIKHEIIHGDVRLPSVYYAVDDKNERFKEGVYAIETFGTRHPKKRRASTSSNGLDPVYEVFERGESTIFRLNPELARYTAAELRNRIPVFKIQSVQKIFSQIRSRFRTLPFCERYMQPSDRTPVSLLVKNGLLLSYPPLCTDPGSITAQFEHTVYVKDSAYKGVSVFSRDDDY